MSVRKIDKIYSLQIGQNNENIAQVKSFDVSDWVEDFPDASYHILFRRPGEVNVQPVISTLTDGVIEWTVGAWETEIIGTGYVEVRAVNSDTGLIKKSHVIPCTINESIYDDVEDPPAAFESWVNIVLAAKADVDASVIAAAASESAAAGSATAAADSATAAAASETAAGTAQTAAETAQAASEAKALVSEGYATGTQDGVEVASGTYYHNNSKFYAEVAQQGAEESGFAWFDVNVQTGLMEVTVTENLADHVSFAVDETTGVLEVTVNG